MTDPVVRGFTIFCDDIRNEEAGKFTFVGVYDTAMFIQAEFPFLLPKFGMAVRYQEKVGAFTNEEARLRIFLPGDDEAQPSFEGVLPMQEIRQKVRTHPSSDTHETQYIQV